MIIIDVNLCSACYDFRLLTILIASFLRLAFLAWITTFYHNYSNLLITLKTQNFLWFV